MASRIRFLAFLLPAVVLYGHAGTAHWSDLAEYRRWAHHERKHVVAPPRTEPVLRNTYLNTSCNYPPLGALATAGAWGVLESVAPDGGPGAVPGAQAFRWYLCLFETLGLALTVLVLRELHESPPWLAAVVFYLVPSSWAGGAVWGQIDVIDHAVLLLAAYCSVRLLMRERTGPAAGSALVVLGLWALVAAALLKWLTLFALPGLLGLWAASLAALGHRHGARRGAATALGATALAGLFAVAMDRLVFVAPAGHSGIVSYVWAVLGWHTRYLSANAPSLWTFLGRDNYSSSDLAFHGDLTPRAAGLALFVTLGGVLALVTAWRLLPAVLRPPGPRRDRVVLCMLLFCFTGLTTFTMFLFVAGAHDRYLVHALPFLFLGLYGLPAAGRERLPQLGLTVALVVAAIYGCFIYGLIDPEAFRALPVLRSQAFVAAVCLLAYAALFLGYLWLMLARPRPGRLGAAGARAASE